MSKDPFEDMSDEEFDKMVDDAFGRPPQTRQPEDKSPVIPKRLRPPVVPPVDPTQGRT